MLSNKYTAYAILLLITLFALALRLPDLDRMPMHHDEANQAIKFGSLLEDGIYEFDPAHHHGPTLYYLSLPVAWLSGQSTLSEIDEHSLRLLPVIAGALIVSLTVLMRGGLACSGIFWASLFMAACPGMVYMSRYFVHEILLITFTAAAIGCGWRFYQENKLRWAILCGLSLGLMHATKESSAITILSIGLAILTAAFLRHKSACVTAITRYLKENIKAVTLAALSAAAISVLFYSSFGSHPQGIISSITTYFNYEVISGHEKSGFYYLHLLIWGTENSGKLWIEVLILLLAICGAISTILQKDKSQKTFTLFIIAYTLITLIVYACIPYKTPWLILTSLYGIILLAGTGAAAIIQLFRETALLKYSTLALLTAITCYNAKEAWMLCQRYYSDDRNPYAYSPTVSDLLNLTERVKAISALHPNKESMLVKVFADYNHYWPIPWYLRTMENIGYWNESTSDPDAAVIITTVENQPALEAKLKDKYFIEYRGLRPGVFLLLYIKQDLWDTYMEQKSE